MNFFTSIGVPGAKDTVQDDWQQVLVSSSVGILGRGFERLGTQDNI